MHYKKQSLARLDTESMSPKGLCKHEPKMGYKAVHTHTCTQDHEPKGAMATMQRYEHEPKMGYKNSKTWTAHMIVAVTRA